MTEQSKEQSWTVLIVTMAFTFLVVRFSPFPYLVAPGIVLVKFLMDKYYSIIDDFGRKVKAKLVSWFSRRRMNYASC